jgi:precorrin-4 methylase
MLFFIRSAFCLGIVYSAMPFDNNEQMRELARLRSELAVVAGTAAIAACANQSVSCGALTAPDQNRATTTRIAADPKAKAPRRSADSLTQADLTAPWRGKLAKPAERQALAKRGEMPI